MKLTAPDNYSFPKQANHFISGIILIVLILFAYFTAFPNVFIYDDKFFLDYLQSDAFGKLLTNIWGSDFYDKGRIFTQLTFYLNKTLGSGSPAEYLWVNLLLHWGNCFLLYQLLLKLVQGENPLTLDPRQQHSRTISLCALMSSSVFAVHPLMVTAVSYITQRSLLLITFFCLSTVLLLHHLINNKQSTIRIIAGSILYLLLFHLSLKSKEIGLTLPLYSLLYWLVYCGEQFFKQRRLKKRKLIFFLPVLLIFLLFVLDLLRGNFYRANFSLLPWGAWQQFKAMGIVTIKELSLLVWPTLQQMNIDQHFDPFQYSDTINFVSLIFHAGILTSALVVFIFNLRRQDRAIASNLTQTLPWQNFCFSKMYSFAIGWYYLSQLPYFLFPELELFVEYKTYPSNIGFSIFVMFFCLKLVQAQRLKVLIIGGVSVILLLSLQTRQRNQLFTSVLGMWKDSAAKQPEKDRAFINIGDTYYKNGDLDLAKLYFYKVLQMKPNSYLGLSNLAYYYLKQNDYVAAAIQLETLEYLLRSEHTLLELRIKTLILLGQIYQNLGYPDSALKFFNEALVLDPKNVIALSETGVLKLNLGQPEEGQKLIKYTLEIDPNHPIVLRNYGLFLISINQPQNAYQNLSKSIQINSQNDPITWSYLGLAAVMVGKPEQACQMMNYALQLGPKNSYVLTSFVVLQNNNIPCTLIQSSMSKPEIPLLP